MTTLFTDTFTRADSTTIGNGWSEVAGNWQISSNQVYEPTTSSSAAYLLQTSGPATADYSVQADITQGALISQFNVGVGVFARYLDTSNFYLAWIDQQGVNYVLYRVSGGTYTEIGRWSTSALADPVTLRLECQGSTIRMFVNGALRVTASDSALTAGGQFGIRAFNTSQFTNWRADNVVVADFGAAGTTVNPGTISSGENVRNPTLTLQVLPDVVGSTLSVPSPTIAVTLLPGTIATAQALYAPNVQRSVAPGAISSAESVSSPTVTMSPLPGQVMPGTILTAEAVYAPTLRLSVLPDAIPSAEMVFQPLSVALPQSVGPDAIASAELVYAPLVT
ncbi:MAG TPA: hypothetical protein VN903_09160, partial [Polyangia bacterium]|nr:hypothetical protein [Polyangia bacterium]